MIISHKHKFIFVRTKKVGSTSIEIALSKYCDNSDILTPVVGGVKRRRELGFTSACNFNKSFKETTLKEVLASLLMRNINTSYYRRLRTKYQGHMPANKIRENIGEKIWKEYLKFTIVRNPFDKLVSHYYFLNWFKIKHPHKKKYSPDNFSFMNLDEKTSGHQSRFKIFIRDNPHLIRENWELYTENNEVLVDNFIRFENFEIDLKRISEKIGLPENAFNIMKDMHAKKNIRPKQSPYQDIIDVEAKEIIKYFAKEEIELFDYKF